MPSSEINKQLIMTQMTIKILPFFGRVSLIDNNSNTVVTSITSTSKKPPEIQNATMRTFVSSSSTAVD